MSFLQDAFKQLSALNEEKFDVDDDGIEKLKDFQDDEQKQVSAQETVTVFDPNASTQDDIEGSYQGKIILDCNVCHSKIFKDENEVQIDEETQTVSGDEECPYCASTQGFKIIGKVEEFDGEQDSQEKSKKDKDETEVDEFDFDDEFEEKETEQTQKDQEEPKKESKKKEQGLKIFKTKTKKGLQEDLKIFITMSDFRPWSGAVDTWYKIQDAGKIDQLESYLQQIYPEGLQDVQLNDILWFDGDQVLVDLGIEKQEDIDESLKQEKCSKVLKNRKRKIKQADETTDTSSQDATQKQSEKKDPNRTIWVIMDKDRNNKIINDFQKREDAIQFVESQNKQHGKNYTYDQMSATQANQKRTNQSLRPRFSRSRLTQDRNARLLSRVRRIVQGKECRGGECRGDDCKERKLKPRKFMRKTDKDMDESREKDTIRRRYIKEARNPENDEFNAHARRFLTYPKKGWIQDSDIRRKKDIDFIKKSGYEVQDDWKPSIRNPKTGRKLTKDSNYSGYRSDYITSTIRHPDLNGDQFEWDKNTSMVRGNDIQAIDQFDYKGSLDTDRSTQLPRRLRRMKNEGFEDISLTTDGGEKIKISAEQADDGFDDFEDIDTSVEVGDETIEPLSDDDKEEIKSKGEQGEQVDVEQVDDEKLESLGESYLKENYSNVKSFKVTKARKTKNGFVVQGLIKFNSGKQRKTRFKFEAYSKTRQGKYRFLGENLSLAGKKKAFELTCQIKRKSIIPESLKYDYVQKSHGRKYQVFGKSLVQSGKMRKLGSSRQKRSGSKVGIIKHL